MDVPFLKFLLVSAITMGISHTVSREKVFEPLRNALGGFATWRGYLVSCPYCFSHWVAFLLVPLTGAYAIHIPYRWPVISPIVDWFLSSIAVTVMAAFLRVGFYFVDEGQRLTKQRKKIVEAEATQVEERITH